MDESNTDTHSLPAIVDLYYVEEWQAELLEEESFPQKIDLSAIEKISTAGLQMLISVMQTAKKINSEVSLVGGENQVVKNAADILGIHLDSLAS